VKGDVKPKRSPKLVFKARLLYAGLNGEGNIHLVLGAGEAWRNEALVKALKLGEGEIWELEWRKWNRRG